MLESDLELKTEPSNILVVRLSSIGDVLMTTPMIKILRDTYPEAYIAYLVEDMSKEMVIGNPYLDETIIFNKSKFKSIHQEEGLMSAFSFLYSLLSELKSKKFDLVIDLHSVFRSNMLSYFTWASRRIGINKKVDSVIYTDKVEPREDLHVVDEYLTLLEPLGINPDNHKKEFAIATSKQDREYIDRLLVKFSVEENKELIALNPATSVESKNWSEEKFAQVGDWINKHLEAEVLILGGPGDLEKAARIVNQMDTRAINLAGKTSLKGLAELLKRVDLLITGDTGPMHMAMAVETPLIALFGPTDPARYGPYQGEHVVIKASDRDIDEIRVETVVEHLTRILES